MCDSPVDADKGGRERVELIIEIAGRVEWGKSTKSKDMEKDGGLEAKALRRPFALARMRRY